MSLNELAEQGAAIEVTFYDADFDEDEEEQGAESRDDFVMLFVGPTPAAIMQVQRDLLVQDVVNMMERHFDGAELGGVVAEIDKLFSQRFDALVNSLEIGKPPRGPGGGLGQRSWWRRWSPAAPSALILSFNNTLASPCGFALHVLVAKVDRQAVAMTCARVRWIQGGPVQFCDLFELSRFP